ncbi:MAG: hypothetical protein KF819_28290 [Labilithrix sp.]|nr:hypothetical protein [Labilithrix sp.]
MHVGRILPPPIRRVFALAGAKIVETLRDAPYVFFAVVIGVALSFRVAIGWVKGASSPQDEAPTFTTTPVHAAASGNLPHEQARAAGAEARVTPELRRDPEAVDGRPGAVRVGRPAQGPAQRGQGQRGHARRGR